MPLIKLTDISVALYDVVKVVVK